MLSKRACGAARRVIRRTIFDLAGGKPAGGVPDQRREAVSVEVLHGVEAGRLGQPREIGRVDALGVDDYEVAHAQPGGEKLD